MNADLEAGTVGVVLITNLPTTKPEGVKRQSEQSMPKKAKMAPKAETHDTKTAMSEVGRKINEGAAKRDVKSSEGVFQKGRIEDAQPNEIQLKQPDEDGRIEQLRPPDTVYFGGDNPQGTSVAAELDPLQKLGKIPASEITRGAADLINENKLTDAQVSAITKNGTVERVTKTMVRRFLDEKGMNNDTPGTGSGSGGDSEVAGSVGKAEGPDPTAFD
jgi:hypothetical protein